MRAIRKRYFARSEAGSFDQPSVNAARAALTARLTSCWLAWATSASFSSLEGETDGNHSAERGLTNLPPMKSPYRFSSWTISRASGAGA